MDVTVVSGVKGGPETERTGKTPHYLQISVQFCVTEATNIVFSIRFFMLNLLDASWSKCVHFCGIPSDIRKRLTPSSPTHKITISLNLSIGCRDQYRCSQWALRKQTTGWKWINKPADIITPHSTERLFNLILQSQQFIWPTFSAALHVWDHIVFLQVCLNYVTWWQNNSKPDRTGLGSLCHFITDNLKVICSFLGVATNMTAVMRMQNLQAVRRKRTGISGRVKKRRLTVVWCVI